MKGFWAGFSGQLTAALLPIIAVGIVALLIWQKLFGGKSLEKVASDTLDAAKTIPGGLVSVASSVLRGEGEGSYITAERQRELAAAYLAQKRAQQGA